MRVSVESVTVDGAVMAPQKRERDSGVPAGAAGDQLAPFSQSTQVAEAHAV